MNLNISRSAPVRTQPAVHPGAAPVRGGPVADPLAAMHDALLGLLRSVAGRLQVGTADSPAGSGAPAPSLLVRRGDTLTKIAARHGTTVAALLRANPQIADPDRIFAGHALALPPGALPFHGSWGLSDGGGLPSLGGERRLHAARKGVPLAPLTHAPASATATRSGGITEADYQHAARELGVSVAAVKAVAEVESRGAGMLPSGRPKVLFEAHHFSRLTGGAHDKSHPGLSSPRWNQALYGAGGEHQWRRLDAAMQLDSEAALKSASYGRFQILGSNHRLAGFKDAKSFVDAMGRGEGEQLRAFVNFVKNQPRMHSELQREDWAGFARLYNGSEYERNQYDRKLATAHDKFDKWR